MANIAKQHIFFLDDELDVCEAVSEILVPMLQIASNNCVLKGAIYLLLT
jgi:hypothetical protein